MQEKNRREQRNAVWKEPWSLEWSPFTLHILFARSLYSCKRFVYPLSSLGGYWNEQQNTDRGINLDIDKLAINFYIAINIYIYFLRSDFISDSWKVPTWISLLPSSRMSFSHIAISLGTSEGNLCDLCGRKVRKNTFFFAFLHSLLPPPLGACSKEMCMCGRQSPTQGRERRGGSHLQNPRCFHPWHGGDGVGERKGVWHVTSLYHCLGSRLVIRHLPWI